jgi:hypothetical protein
VIERLGRSFDDELRRLGPSGAIGTVVEAWPSLVGDAIARNAWPARLSRDGTLHVSTSSSAWAFELVHLEGELLARLHGALGESAPARLRFAAGRLPEPPAPAPLAGATAAPDPGPAERAAAAELAAPIEDEDLRSLVARAAAASLARTASGRAV